MREILFRAMVLTEFKNQYRGFSYGFITKRHNRENEIQFSIQTPLWYDKIKSAMVQVVPETIGQYTELNDKNNKKIFDGDILSDWNEVDGEEVQSKLQVFWNKKVGAWFLDNSYNQDKSNGELLSKELDLFIYEITGNIHEIDIEILIKKP